MAQAPEAGLQEALLSDEERRRNSKHRSRSRSPDRKRKSGDKRHRRSHSRSKEARKKASEKALRCRSGSEEQLETSDKDMEERRRRKDKKSSRPRSLSRSRSRERYFPLIRLNQLERAKKLQEQKEKELLEKRQQQEIAAGSPLTLRLERAKKLQEQKEKELLEKRQQQEIAAEAAPLLCDTAAAAPSPGLNVAALLASGTQVTPQIAMAAQMAALQAKTLAETGIAVPSYYNPSAVNPMKFAEQEKKRKMLWQGKKEGDKSQTAELWEKLSFGNKDQNVKFRKLMGIKVR
ncbi:arginine/serine-rich coiled-coil protein 2-like, partial [Sinocyclocheilus grahami]|uniref:arginine/serine-rich coiled-coil protein 2-like n=1 Tax=Sinocyclocheilus grahami TaxID=75366 RepID=UPI0007AD6229